MEQGSYNATPSGGTRSQGDCVTEVCSYMDIPYNLCDDNGIFHCNLIDFLLERVALF